MGLRITALTGLIMCMLACAHSDTSAKKKRHHKAHAQDANAPAKDEESHDEEEEDGRAPVTEPRALGPDTWEVEAEGRTLEEAAQLAVHAAVVWCGERKQMPLPEADSHRRTRRGVRLTFTFHCVQVQQDPPPMPMMDLDPMPLDRD